MNDALKSDNSEQPGAEACDARQQEHEEDDQTLQTLPVSERRPLRVTCVVVPREQPGPCGEGDGDSHTPGLPPAPVGLSTDSSSSRC